MVIGGKVNHSAIHIQMDLCVHDDAMYVGTNWKPPETA